MPHIIRHAGVLAMILAVIPAYAQVYKWVDERGVTNYSSEPPAARKRELKPAAVADRISVYTPEPALQRTISASSQVKDRILSGRIDSLERQLAAERLSSQHAAAAEARAAQAAYAQCVAERRVDCDYDSGYYPYGLGGAVSVAHHRPRPRVPTMTRSRVATENLARSHSGGNLRRAEILQP